VPQWKARSKPEAAERGRQHSEEQQSLATVTVTDPVPRCVQQDGRPGALPACPQSCSPPVPERRALQMEPSGPLLPALQRTHPFGLGEEIPEQPK
jgi:hypothetical protein